MNNTVYKTKEGRNIVESIYRKVLSEYSSASFEQLFVSTETERTHVLRFGKKSKPPLIMIHGTASNSAIWLGNVPDFIDQFCVYCVDIPGEPGLSEPIRRPLASEAPYKWLSSLLNNLNIEKASFVTVSLGSWYTLNFAVQSSERVNALSMITTPGIVPASRSFIFKAVFLMMLGKTGQKMINKMIYHKTEVSQEVLDFQSVVSKHFIPLMEIIPVFSDAELKNISAPIQFFGGDHDALIDSVKTGKRLQGLLHNSDINILTDTGHVIIDQFAVIKEFLTSN